MTTPRGRTPAEILEGLTVKTAEPGAPPGSQLDIPIPLTDSWRSFLETWGTGEVPTRGAALQVGGQIGIVVNLETLLGLNAPPAAAESGVLIESREVSVATTWDLWGPSGSMGSSSPTFSPPELEGALAYRLAGITLVHTTDRGMSNGTTMQVWSYQAPGEPPYEAEDCFQYCGNAGEQAFRPGARAVMGPAGNADAVQNARTYVPIHGFWRRPDGTDRVYVIEARHIRASDSTDRRYVNITARFEVQLLDSLDSSPTR